MNRKQILIIIILITILAILLVITFSPADRYKELIVSESKWNSIISNREESQELSLETIEFNDYRLMIDEDSSTLYYSLIENSRNKYKPDVKFKTTDGNAKIAILSDEMTDEKVENNHEFKIMIYNDSEYHIYNLVCTKLPVLNISYDTKAIKKNKDKNIPMEIYLFNNADNSVNRVAISRGKLSILDNDEYAFSLTKMSPGRNERENNISILNMDQNSEYTLSSAGDDVEENTGNYVELFINGEYKGEYLLK